MRMLLFLTLSLGIANVGTAQITYITPTHLYNSLTEVTNSTRADALGKNTITLNGIRSAFDNPAAISPGAEKMQVAFNFFNGHPFHFKSQNYFLGATYKIKKRFSVGVSTHQWIDNEAAWSSIIATVETPTNKQSQQTYSLHAAAKIIDNLHFGISGNYIAFKSIEGLTTSDDFLLNIGFIYDRPIQLLSETIKASNENLRVAIGFTNLLYQGRMIQRKNDSVWQYRDLPIVLRLGAAYGISLPLEISLPDKLKKLKALPKTLDLSARIQYNDWLKHKDHIYDEYKANTLIGIGIEATALQILSVRLGYFRETRPIGDDPSKRYATLPVRKGLTWGLGLQIPSKIWSDNKLPFNIRFDLMAKNHPKSLNENVSARTSPEFTTKKMLLGLGFELSF